VRDCWKESGDAQKKMNASFVRVVVKEKKKKKKNSERASYFIPKCVLIIVAVV
jgi:hypothetical protein